MSAAHAAMRRGTFFMSMSFEDALTVTGNVTLRTLAKFESIQRRMHPSEIHTLREELAPFGAELAQALEEYAATEAPPGLEPLRARLLEAATLTSRACERFCEDAPAEHWVMGILSAMRTFARALEALYPLHRLPPVGRYFAEPAFHERLSDLDPDPPRSERIGLHATGDANDPGERGGFCLYVPEHYDESRCWPLVVTLHGGSGTGRDYLWLWLREARGRGFVVLAPTSFGPTWSMVGPDVDQAAVRSMVEHVCSNWSIDRERILLTGLSDGATYGLTLALWERSPFAAVAAIAGVLHPKLLLGDAAAIQGKRIYLVHGALDWMFPVEQARVAADELRRRGADVVYRELHDLSHTYPREENDRILSWFDDSLSLPRSSAPQAS